MWWTMIGCSEISEMQMGHNEERSVETMAAATRRMLQ